MPKQNYNYRKKWYKGQQKIGAGGAEICLRLTLQLGYIAAISLIDLEELLSIIKEAQYKENILLQMAVLKAYLK